jgi:ATP-binding cassette subfamily B protein
MATSSQHVASPLGRLLDYSKPHRRTLWLASLCSVLNKIFDLAPPLLIGVAIDLVVKGDASWIASLGFETFSTQLWAIAAMTVVIWVAESLFEYAFGVLWRGLAQTLQHEMRIDAYKHVQSLEPAFFEDRSSGGLMAILNDDVNQLERFLDNGANNLIQVATTVIAIGGMYLMLSPSIALFAIAPMPFIVWGSVRYQRLLAPRYDAVREDVGALSADLSGNLQGIATIQSYTAEKFEVDRLGATSLRYSNSNRSAIRLSSAFSPMIRMAVLTGFLGTLIVGGHQVHDGALEVGVFSTVVYLTQRLLWPLTRLGETFDLYQRAMSSTTRILDLLDVEPKIQSGPTPLPIEDVQGELRLKRAHFSYRNGVPIFAGLNLCMPAGHTTAIVGSTGAGKSTLIRLLLRFSDVTGGTVSLDGINVMELRLEDLRGAIGLVSQDVFLFHGTVAENIAYGRPNATPHEISAAARAAEADDFISAFPEGYETLVGERGQKLSGGQRQRISIARAILKNPPILILDEATSSVDNETEAAIQRSFAAIAAGRTTILIAHRLSTVRHANCIHVLEAGRIVESGTHEELVTKTGVYAGLWSVQTGETS